MFTRVGTHKRRRRRARTLTRPASRRDRFYYYSRVAADPIVTPPTATTTPGPPTRRRTQAAGGEETRLPGFESSGPARSSIVRLKRTNVRALRVPYRNYIYIFRVLFRFLLRRFFWAVTKNEFSPKKV